MSHFQLFISIFTSVMGTVCFAMVWNMENKYIPYAALNGFLTWVMYLICEAYGCGNFTATLAASLVGVLVAEFMARATRKNAAQFRISGLVCLIPGSGLYHTMDALIRSDSAMVHSYAMSTSYTVFGIAGGICLGSALIYMFKVIVDGNKNNFAY